MAKDRGVHKLSNYFRVGRLNKIFRERDLNMRKKASKCYLTWENQFKFCRY